VSVWPREKFRENTTSSLAAWAAEENFNANSPAPTQEVGDAAGPSLRRGQGAGHPGRRLASWPGSRPPLPGGCRSRAETGVGPIRTASTVNRVFSCSKRKNSRRNHPRPCAAGAARAAPPRRLVIPSGLQPRSGPCPRSSSPLDHHRQPRGAAASSQRIGGTAGIGEAGVRRPRLAAARSRIRSRFIVTGGGPGGGDRR